MGGLMKNSIVFNKSEEPTYKPRRKLIAHSFYASKLRSMSDTIFDVIHERLLTWDKQHPSGEIDLVEELVDIQGEIVVSVSIGREWTKERLAFKDPKTGQTEKIEIGYFIGRLLNSAMMRDGQPINLLFPELLPYIITASDKIFRENQITLKNFFSKVKEVKLAGLKEGKKANDLLSILLSEGQDTYGVLGDEAETFMFDDIGVIFFAATNTTQVSVNNALKYLYMDKYADVRKKLVQEVDSNLPFSVWDAQGNEVNHDKLYASCNYENIHEGYDYAMMTFNESLRIEPPLGFSTAHTVTRDVTLARGTAKELKINAGEEIHIMIGLLHHDPAQWGNRHDEFIPERFDSKSEYFSKPGGKHRHPYSFAPFLGGHRVCLGKTMAEIQAKAMLVMITKCYELEHLDSELKTKTRAYELFQMQLPSLRYRFKKRI